MLLSVDVAEAQGVTDNAHLRSYIENAYAPAVISKRSGDILRRNVRRLMDETPCTQRDLAAYLGIRQSAMSKKIRGSVGFSMDDLDALARCFKVPVPWLLVDWSNPVPPYERRSGTDRRGGTDRRRWSSVPPRNRLTFAHDTWTMPAPPQTDNGDES